MAWKDLLSQFPVALEASNSGLCLLNPVRPLSAGGTVNSPAVCRTELSLPYPVIQDLLHCPADVHSCACKGGSPLPGTFPWETSTCAPWRCHGSGEETVGCPFPKAVPVSTCESVSPAFLSETHAVPELGRLEGGGEELRQPASSLPQPCALCSPSGTLWDRQPCPTLPCMCQPCPLCFKLYRCVQEGRGIIRAGFLKKRASAHGVHEPAASP
ncbi:uncharacterized protein LOC123521193 [Echinops telfairi]|uniref:Uncharacterized protein LOC123521193 n=1 Tax=Echinops telfairi TaxID=9371 RepID=A0AC55CNG5_ECHTE|nr:uncharacterized protein LOC123521193 [Echinops telfairi]